MGFIMGGLDSDSYDRQYSDRVLLRRILSYFKPQSRPMITSAVVILLAAISDALLPIALAKGIDLLASQPSLAAVLLFCGAVILLQSLGWVMNYIRQRNSARAIADVVLKLREDVFQAVSKHDLSFYDEQPTGKLVSRITSDTQDFSTTVDLTMNLVSQLGAIILVAIFAFSVSVKLTLILLAMTPIVFVIALGFRKIARRVTQNARRVMAKVNANIQESVSGIAIAKGFRQEATMYDDFKALNRQAYGVNLTRGLVMATIFPIIGGTFGLVAGVMLYFGGSTALQGLTTVGGLLPVGAITIGGWYLFIQAMGIFWFPMTNIASFWSQFQDGLSSAERVFALIDAKPQVIQADNQPVPRLLGEIHFRHVHLSYTGKDVVLPDLNLIIPAHETIALVGHTGAGKTSIARLLGRFYEFQSGEILVDGHDIRTFNLEQYRRQLGFVPQVPFLFSGSVSDNIRYGRPEATDAEVAAIAHEVAGGDWVKGLPDGLASDVGERGARLSMGQRQLVALARVLLHNPAIFILDEATASVDPFTEVQIQRGLVRVMQNRTSLVIAHRLFTVRHAHRIIVLKDGAIIEEGNHNALLERKGHYAELYDTYFRHQSLDYIERAAILVKAKLATKAASG
ncbi:MAG: ABC transporter ATP-binding protein [Anaerolineae bacterium]